MRSQSYKTQDILQTEYDDNGRLTPTYSEDEDCIVHISHFNESQRKVFFRCNSYIVTIVFHNQTFTVAIQSHHAALLAAVTWNHPFTHDIARLISHTWARAGCSSGNRGAASRA